MRKIIFLVLLLSSVSLNVYAQTSISYRQQAWDLGSNLSMAALVNAAGSDSGLTGRTFTSAKANAKNLRITLPELPAKTNDKIKDDAAALYYLLNTTGMPIMKILGQDFGAEHAALFEIAFKTNILLMLYDPDGKETTTIVNVINKRRETAKLPNAAFAELKSLVAGRAGFDAIKNEIFALQKRLPKYIASNEFSENGEALYERKEFAKSVAEFNKALQISPAEPKYYYLRGRSHLQDNKCSEAVTDYTKVIQLAQTESDKANLPTVYQNRSLCQMLLKKYPQALTDINMSIKLRPEYASAYKLRSLIHKQMGSPKLADADFQKAERLQPGIMKN